MARIFMALNGKRINSLADLKNNFNPNQVLAFCRSKRLHAWLEEQGCLEELEKLNSFDTEMDDDTLLSMLMTLFDLNGEPVAEAKKGTAVEIEDRRESEISRQKDAHWFLGKMSRDVFENAVEVNCESIGKNSLGDMEYPGDDADLCIKSIFYYDGFFFARLHSYDGDEITVQSSDLKHWNKNEAVSDLSFDDKHIVFGDEHCFAFSVSGCGDLVIGSSSTEWTTRGLSFLEGYTVVSLYEKNKRIGIFYTSKEKSGIIWADSVYAISKRKFTSIDFPDDAVFGCIKPCFFFKDRYFYWSGGSFRSVDMVNWRFESPACDWCSPDSLGFAFDEIAFVVVRPVSQTDSWGVYYTTDGLAWKEIEFDFDDMLPYRIFKADNVYYVLTENQGGYCKIFRSFNGVDWKLWQEICCDGYSLVGEAGNGNLLFMTGEDQYLFCSIY